MEDVGTQPGRSGSLTCNQQDQWLRPDSSARPPTYPRAEIKAIQRELRAWMEDQPWLDRGYAAAERVVLSLEYCLMNPGERLGEIALAKDVAELATAVGR